MMHIAIAEKLTGKISSDFRLGCIIPDAAGQQSHYRARSAEGLKYFDLVRFRSEFTERLRGDDFCLGFYMHLLQDMLYRTFLYREKNWETQTPGNVEKLHNDYRLLNPYLSQKYGIANDLFLPEHLCGHPLLPDRAEAFLTEFRTQFEPVEHGELFFLTEAMADEFIERAVLLCEKELNALRGCGECINPLDYAY